MPVDQDTTRDHWTWLMIGAVTLLLVLAAFLWTKLVYRPALYPDPPVDVTVTVTVPPSE